MQHALVARADGDARTGRVEAGGIRSTNQSSFLGGWVGVDCWCAGDNVFDVKLFEAKTALLALPTSASAVKILLVMDLYPTQILR
jgi:hypothetical protein